MSSEVTAAWIVGGLRMRNMSRKTLSERTGIAESTLNWLIRNPDEIKQKDIFKIRKVIGAPGELADALNRL